MNKKFKDLFRDTIIFALGSFGSRVILFFLVPLYTNYLSTEEYGIADLVFTTAQMIIPIVSIVIFEAVIRFGLTKDQPPAEVLKAGMIIGAIGTVSTVALTPLLGLYSPISPWKWYLCVYVILNFNTSILKSYLKVKDKNKQFALISVLQTLCLALLNVLLLAILHVGIRGYLVSNIAATGMALILAALFSGAIQDISTAPLNRPLLLQMAGYSAPLIINDLSWWVIHSSDKFMIEAMVSASALGIFTAATKVPSLINVLISIFGQAWNISSIKEMDSSNDSGFYSKVFSGYTLFTFGACVILVAIIKPFMDVYVGNEFKSAWMYVPLLLASAVFSSISSYFGQLYAALKKPVNNMLSTFVGAVVNIVVNYIFIKMMGIWGAVIGTVVAYIVVAVFRMIDVRRFVEIQIDMPRFLMNCLIILAQSILVSVGMNPVIISVICIAVFLGINYHSIYGFLSSILSRNKV